MPLSSKCARTLGGSRSDLVMKYGDTNSVLPLSECFEISKVHPACVRLALLAQEYVIRDMVPTRNSWISWNEMNKTSLKKSEIEHPAIVGWSILGL